MSGMPLRRRGLSLVEALSVVTILGVLAALLYPVFKNVRMRALDAQCIEKLRQYGAALAIYRHEYGGDGVYGHPYAMGLPPTVGGLGLPFDTYYCPLGNHVRNTFIPHPELHRDDDLPAWIREVRLHREDTIIQADLNHNDWGRRIASPYMDQKGIGLYLGGYVRVLVKTGDPARPEFWYEEGERE